MVERRHPRLSVVRQCRLLGIARAGVYRRRQARRRTDLELMELIDRQYLICPFYGSRRMAAFLRRLGYRVNRKRVQRLMREMALEPIYPKPRTSKPHPGHKVYPYLLRGLTIDRVDQVWCADVSYIPMARGFLYLVAVMDWASRKVLAWQLSNTLDAGFCVAALEAALATGRRPDIFNTDQGVQFTSAAFTEVLKAHDIRISMDGRGRCLDNVFVERLWRSLKYEEVYLHAYESVAEAKAGISAWVTFYNHERLHQGLGERTPAEVYAAGGPWACGRSASPTGCADPGSLRNPGTCSPSTTCPQAQQQPGFDSTKGLHDHRPLPAPLPHTETPADQQGRPALT